jgi:hypothetical protein
LRNIIIAFVVIAVLHSSLSYYVSHVLGSRAGKLVANLILKSTEDSNAIEYEKVKIDDEMRKTRETWRPMIYVLSVPLGSVIKPIDHWFSKKYVFVPILQQGKKYSEIKFSAQAISYTAMTVNSLSFSGLIVGIWSLLRKWIVRRRIH